jgi:Lrp/AsnC family transcriptional regulator of ectoine degradation
MSAPSDKHPARTGQKLDSFDLRILSEIQRDGRITKLALAEKVGLSPTPCWTRLKRLEDIGVITGYHARLSARAVGPIASVFVEVTLGSHRQADFDRFETAIRNEPAVTSCWALGGGVDYLLKTVTSDIDSYQRLMDRLLEAEIGIDRYFTYIVTRVVKDEPELPLQPLLDSGA